MQEVRLDPDHPPRCSLVLGRGPVRVRGHVLDASFGKPIPGAKVWIHGLKQSLALAREGRAIADGSGCFEILGIGSEGGAVLSVLAEDFEEGSWRMNLRVGDNTFSPRMVPLSQERRVRRKRLKRLAERSRTGEKAEDPGQKWQAR